MVIGRNVAGPHSARTLYCLTLFFFFFFFALRAAMHAASVETGIPGLNPVPIDQTA